MVGCSKHASTQMHLQWQRWDIRYCERSFSQRGNFWRDVFAGKLAGRAISGLVNAVWSRGQAVA